MFKLYLRMIAHWFSQTRLSSENARTHTHTIASVNAFYITRARAIAASPPYVVARGTRDRDPQTPSKALGRIHPPLAARAPIARPRPRALETRAAHISASIPAPVAHRRTPRRRRDRQTRAPRSIARATPHHSIVPSFRRRRRARERANARVRTIGGSLYRIAPGATPKRLGVPCLRESCVRD